MRFSLQIEIQLKSLKINTVVCNSIMKFSHSAFRVDRDQSGCGTSQWGGGGGGGGGGDVMASPIVQSHRGVLLPRPNVTRCF